MTTLFTMILWVSIGAATAYLASQRGRDPYIWFALGMFFGILAMLAVVLLPPVKSEEEIEVDRKNEGIVAMREKQVEEEERLESAPDLQPQSVETKEWFYLDKNHQQQGPFSFFGINEAWENRDITSNSFVWSEGMEEWKQIHEIDDLYTILERLESENRKTFPEDL